MPHSYYPPVSANTLFHFTNKLENLIGILTAGFRPRYCLENYNLFLKKDFSPQEHFEWAIPMVCFCDLPLSQTRYHSSVYGNYIIGMTKDWGVKKRISPVLYSYQESTMIGHIGTFFRLANEIKDNAKTQDDFVTGLHKLLSLIKPYQGDLWRKAGIKKNVRFYDEREWRFVADIPGLDGRLFLEKPDFFCDELRSECNASVGERFRLTFTAKDIRYLIVPKEAQIAPFVKRIRRISTLNENEMNLMCSKITSAEQLRKDF